jgi:fumarate hydratase class II
MGRRLFSQVVLINEEEEMPSQRYRTEKDSLGEVKVPAKALYMAQTQRALENFPISGLKFSRPFIRSLGLIKAAAASVNQELGLLDRGISKAISAAAKEVADGVHDDHFPVDIFQTGSGTSTNMNANEVIATRARQLSPKLQIHPNDHVNLGQSSNDVIPSAIHIAALLETRERLLPALEHLHDVLVAKAQQHHDIIKTGRTHLMDALPIRLSQEVSGWAAQVANGMDRIKAVFPRLGELALGGTAVGTGVNTHKEFGKRIAAKLAAMTGARLTEARNHFEAQASQDAAIELSGQLKVVSLALGKISNDLRLMNSGPNAGLGEIELPALQPGSSIMPGKVNPVIPEAVQMVTAQVVGNDATITFAAGQANFELSTMLPVIAYNLLLSLHILANAARLLADKAIAGFVVRREVINRAIEINPILATALTPAIGYEASARIAKQAHEQRRSIKEVAAEKTNLTRQQLEQLLDPQNLTSGGFQLAESSRKTLQRERGNRT